MSDLPDEPLPDDLPACHNLIRELRLKVANLRRVVVGTLGYDPTEVSAPGAYQRAMSRPMTRLEEEAVSQMLAAEDAMRARRKKK